MVSTRSPSTTRIYDRSGNQLTLQEIERVQIREETTDLIFAPGPSLAGTNFAVAMSAGVLVLLGRPGRSCRVSIGALDEPVNGPRPQLFLSPTADGESNVAGWPDDLFLVGGTDQVVERLGLGARNEVVVAGHQV